MSDEEFSQVFGRLFGDDKPVLMDILEKSGILNKVRSSGKTVGEIVQKYNEKLPEIKRFVQNNALLGKDSILYKKLKDINSLQILPLLKKLYGKDTEMQRVFNRLEKMLSSNPKLSLTLDKKGIMYLYRKNCLVLILSQ